jgi:tetratricopeptide (TPR) repeat protein
MPPHALAGDDPATCVFPTGSTLSPELAGELPHEAAFALWQVLRCVALWTAEPEGVRREVFDRGYMERWERALLKGTLDPEARFPLAVVVSEMAAAPAGAGRLPWACVCVADWALGRGAHGAALAFAEAAARAAPQQPRYAWLAGRLLRRHGKPRDGERWLRRAHRLAVAQRDWETQARSLTSLGNLFVDIGRHGDARHYHSRALRIAQRFRLREQEAMAFHDLFAVAIQDGRRAEAERYARGALGAYRSNDHRIPQLAHDVAYFWMTQGHFALALSVFLALRPDFTGPDSGLKLLANTAHAAAGTGDHALFARLHLEAEALIPELATTDTLAAALLELACGAALVRDWSTALTLAARAEEVARTRGESNILLRTEALSTAVSQRDQAGIAQILPGQRALGVEGERFAGELLATLERNRAESV